MTGLVMLVASWQMLLVLLVILNHFVAWIVVGERAFLAVIIFTVVFRDSRRLSIFVIIFSAVFTAGLLLSILVNVAEVRRARSIIMLARTNWSLQSIVIVLFVDPVARGILLQMLLL